MALLLGASGAELAAAASRGQAGPVLDERLQALVERIVAPPDAAAVLDLGARRVVALVNGAALARPARPGSVFKLVTASALLASGAPEREQRCAGALDLDGRRYECWQRTGHGPVRLLQALAQSCNVYFYARSAELDPGTLLAEARRLGLGQASGLGLPGEGPGSLPLGIAASELPELAVGDSDLVWVTGGQLLGLAGRLAGHPAWSAQAAPQDELLRQAMRMAMLTGTGGRPGPRLALAGKTGTARKGQSWRYQGWFIGFVPLDRPAYALVVLVDAGVGRDAASLGEAIVEALEATQRNDMAAGPAAAPAAPLTTSALHATAGPQDSVAPCTSPESAGPRLRQAESRGEQAPCAAQPPRPADPGGDPDQPQVRLRLFERLAPRTLLATGAGPLQVSGQPWPGGQVRLALAGGELLLDGERPAMTGAVRLPAGARLPPDRHLPGGAASSDPGARGVRLTAPGGLWLDPGGDGRYRRLVPGTVVVEAAGASLRVLARLPLEEYVAGVVQAELWPAPPAALEAQAILARGYALAEAGRHAGAGPAAGYDFCDLTHCQVWQGAADHDGPARQAAALTAGQVLLGASGQPAAVAYHSTCGGHTADAVDVWGGAPELVGVPDRLGPGRPELCRASPHFEWTFEESAAAVLAALRRREPGAAAHGMAGARLGQAGEPLLPGVLEVAPSGWVRWWQVAGQRLSGEQAHLALGASFGWGRFKSGRFTVQLPPAAPDGPRLRFSGRGLGHGVGLCQYGARELARQGWSAAMILRHYFPRLWLDAARPEEATGRQGAVCARPGDGDSWGRVGHSD